MTIAINLAVLSGKGYRSHSSHSTGATVAPVAETGFSHRLTAYKIVGHFFERSYRKISGSDQVKNSFFFLISNISVPCPHAQLRGRSHYKVMNIFRTLGSGSLSVTAILDFSGKANTSIHGLGENDTARATAVIRCNLKP